MINTLQYEATAGQFIFSFVFFNTIILLTYWNARYIHNRKIGWASILLFCLYAFWDPDYFTFKYIMLASEATFRDPLYYYLTFASFGSYTFYRLIIWGASLLMIWKICQMFNINTSLYSYIFAVFFLLTFSFARASLGMALYFYGLSILLKKGKFNICGILLILSSYFGHRSMLPLIVLTPLVFIKFSRKKLLLLVCLFPIIVATTSLIIHKISDTNSTGEHIDGFSSAVKSYSSIQDFELNWKFKLITIVRNASHYVLCLYVIWQMWFKQIASYKKPIPDYINRFAVASIIICCIALALSLSNIGIASVTSKRYLYMSGIPLCICMTYLTQEKMCSWKRLRTLLFISLLWSEGYFIGKYLSYYQ